MLLKDYPCFDFSQLVNGVPVYVLENIDNLPDACSAKGITMKQLADMSNVDISVIAKYRRHEKWPCRSIYNRMAKALGIERWKHTKRWE